MERHAMESRLSRPDSSRTRRGYTIIEVLVAVALLTIALPGLVSLVVGGRKAQVASLHTDQAVGVGQQVLDSIQLQPATLAVSGLTRRIVGGTDYDVRVIVNRLTNPPRDSSRLVAVRVGWRQGASTRSVVISGVVR